MRLPGPSAGSVGSHGHPYSASRSETTGETRAIGGCPWLGLAESAWVLTSAQAATAGIGRRALTWRAEHGSTARAGYGLYRLPHWPAESNDEFYALQALAPSARTATRRRGACFERWRAEPDFSDATPEDVAVSVMALSGSGLLRRARRPLGSRSPDREHRTLEQIHDIAAAHRIPCQSARGGTFSAGGSSWRLREVLASTRRNALGADFVRETTPALGETMRTSVLVGARGVGPTDYE